MLRMYYEYVYGYTTLGQIVSSFVEVSGDTILHEVHLKQISQIIIHLQIELDV